MNNHTWRLYRIIIALLLCAAMLVGTVQAAPASQASTLPQAVVGVTWELISIQHTPQDIQNTTNAGITLILSANSNLGGLSGCNTYTAPYTSGEAQALTVGEIIQTLRACEEPAMSLEMKYLDALKQVARYSLDGATRLQLRSADGQSILSYVARAVPAGEAERCFEETGFCIRGRIRTFWEQNGGLAVFGFPITPQREEQVEGQPLQVQWFERNRLELHPENARPYDVQLGRIGVDRLAQMGRDWFAFPPATNTNAPNCRFFAETNHTVCGEFLTAYLRSGLDLGQPGVTFEESLALFGMPLSQEMTETVEGREYTVQWFERGRFEFHPENNPPYTVLFGRLGAEFSVSAGGSIPAGATVVRGTVSYLQRIALPDNATIVVQLVDVSRQDAPATVISEQTIVAGGKQVPFAFELPYDPARIDPNFTYAVQASIIVDGQVRFRNTSQYRVLTQGNPNTVEVLVEAV